MLADVVTTNDLLPQQLTVATPRIIHVMIDGNGGDAIAIVNPCL